MKIVHISKNVSLEAGNYDLIIELMHNKNNNFSGALNHIIREWDKMCIELYRYKKLQENNQKTLKDAKFQEKNEKEVKNAKKT